MQRVQRAREEEASSQKPEASWYSNRSLQDVAVDRILVSAVALEASYALLHEPLGRAENHNICVD